LNPGGFGSTLDTFLLTGSSYPNPFGRGPPGAKQTLCKEERELRGILTEWGVIHQEKARPGRFSDRRKPAWEDFLEPFHSETRYIGLLKRMGLPQ
jgi:hypothetical protein